MPWLARTSRLLALIAVLAAAAVTTPSASKAGAADAAADKAERHGTRAAAAGGSRACGDAGGDVAVDARVAVSEVLGGKHDVLGPGASSSLQLDTGGGTQRKLQRTSVSGVTTYAAIPYGLPLCRDESNRTWCSVGCWSKFYTVEGTGGQLSATTCDPGTDGNFDTRLIVREGGWREPCSLHHCVGTCISQVSWASSRVERRHHCCW
jgi:hypothetical protein